MAIEFARLGAYLTLTDINEKGLEETKELIRKDSNSDSRVLILKSNVADR